MQIFGEMVRGREKGNSVLNSEPQKFISLAKIFKNVFNNCKHAGLCNSSLELQDNLFLADLIINKVRKLPHIKAPTVTCRYIMYRVTLRSQVFKFIPV
jgi:hypothetical protein